MSDTNELTATEERAALNKDGAPIVPINRDVDEAGLDPATGAPAGQIRDESSPLDPADQATAKT
jgi:hypothetical protein